MKITFLNVGQGDSIVFHWNSDNQEKTAIIDSNIIDNNVNRTIDYIKQNKINQIEYLILSHPHTDHFSGLSSLLDYCDTNKIFIKYFLHTCNHAPEYLKSVVSSITEEKKLIALFKKIANLIGKGIIGNIAPLQSDFNPDVKLNSELYFTILSPSNIEKQDFIKQALPKIRGESETNNPNANYLSTVLKLEDTNNNCFILLTSDAEKRTFKRIRQSGLIKNESICLLGQIPHHGAKRNHYSSFWKTLNNKGTSSMVVSVGKNHYGHPSKDVVDFFTKEKYMVYSTQYSGLYINRTVAKKTDLEITLDVFSEIVEDYKDYSSGDKSFELTNNGTLSMK